MLLRVMFFMLISLFSVGSVVGNCMWFSVLLLMFGMYGCVFWLLEV